MLCFGVGKLILVTGRTTNSLGVSVSLEALRL